MGRKRGLWVKRLYDGTTAAPQDNVIVLLDGQNIEAVYPASQAPELMKQGVEVLDDSDKIMTPGLIDVHTHLMMEGNGTLAEYTLAENTIGEIQLLGLKNALKALRAGVTTIRDNGSVAGVSRNVKNFINKGRILGPDVVICGAAVTSTGGHCHYMGGEADGVDGIRKLIRRQQKEGIDFVKLMATAGGTLGIARGNTFQPEEYQAAVEESHRLGLKIDMHVCSYEGVQTVIDTGLDGMEHCMFQPFDSPDVIFDEALSDKLAEKKIMLCHTLPALGATLVWLDNKPKEMWTAFDDSEYKRISHNQENLYRTIKFHYDHGCLLVAGSDSGWKHCDFSIGLPLALKLMVQSGIPNKEVLISATSRPAAYLGLADRLGTVRAGMQADLVLVNEDPMEDITTFQRVAAVYKKGQLVDRVL